ncbi:MAG TPA: hypothetical protein VHM88_27000, partial [Candidatus Acidoferrales bacterium]|nr:hypothetical protein [Candidatus Acidoferrales bacterium]
FAAPPNPFRFERWSLRRVLVPKPLNRQYGSSFESYISCPQNSSESICVVGENGMDKSKGKWLTGNG